MTVRALWLLLASIVVAAPIQAAERVEEGTAAVLELRSNTARIAIEVTPGDKVTFRARGKAEDLGKIKVERDGSTFSIIGPPSRAVASGAVVGSVTNFATNGSVAVTQIGGGVDAEPPVEFHLSVPSGTRLVVDDLTGELTAGDLKAPVSVSVAAASVRLGEVGPAELRVEGAGDITVAAIKGRSRLVLDGSGTIEVESGSVEHLDIDLSGVGDITAGVEARNATIDFSGVGSVEVERVVSSPRIREEGVGSVVVGR